MATTVFDVKKKVDMYTLKNVHLIFNWFVRGNSLGCIDQQTKNYVYLPKQKN